MSDYQPPLRDMKFALEHIADINSLCALQEFEHADQETISAALDEAGRFLSEVVAPTNRTGDIVGSVLNADGTVTTPPGFKKAYDQYVAAGWGAITGQMDHGGHQMPAVVGAAVQEMMASSNMAWALCPMLTASSIIAFQAHGTDEQKSTYLPKLMTGEWSGTMLITEPQAGSDLGVVRTKAVPSDDGTWSIAGQKIFITYGEHDMADNIIHMVLARAPEAPAGTRGLSMFIVPKYLVNRDGTLGERNGIFAASIEHKLGIRASPTCVMDLEQATGFLVGDVHQGMRLMFTMMNDARLHIGLQGLGISVRAYQQALQFAQERLQGRRPGSVDNQPAPIIEHPDVRRMLITMKANIDAMRALMYDTAAAIDRADHARTAESRAAASARAALLTPISKAWATDVGVELTSIGLQIHGGMGYIEETGAAQYVRDARITPIYEGTNGIQAIDLALRKLPMDGGRVVTGFLDEMDAFAEEFEGDDFGERELATALRTAVRTIRTASDHLLGCDDVADVLAGASPYLRMFGTVAGGYYLARLALAAHRTGNGDAWHQSKIEMARFYAGQIMPQAVALLEAVTAPADVLFAVDPEHLGA